MSVADPGRPDPDLFLAGVIEGFYGPPWTRPERVDLFEKMRAWSLNAYFYAPKDDIKQRAAWREPCSESELAELAELIALAGLRGIQVIYALSPGLDIRYSDPSDLQRIQARFEQLLSLGRIHFALLFDDIPDRMDSQDSARWSSLASAQCHVANAAFHALRQRAPGARFLFCPTAYCSRMVSSGLGGRGYLEDLGRELSPEIEVLWTGPEIISREITIAHLEEVSRALRRRPIIWDNLFANDYDARRFYCGPYSGRPPEIQSATRGILINPNCEAPLNDAAIHAFAAFIRADGERNPREFYLDAMRSWHSAFADSAHPISLDDLILFGDFFYLPHQDGDLAADFFHRLRVLLSKPPGSWGEEAESLRRIAIRVRDICSRLPELRRRPLFHALNRRVWELREEMDLFEKYIASKASNPHAPFFSDFHLPGTYRGSFVARLQGLLNQAADGSFAPAISTAPDSAQSGVETAPPMPEKTGAQIRHYRPGDEQGCYYVCLKTGDYGGDGEPFYREDPDALGRIFVGPYLAFEPELALVLEDDQGICGYALAALDSRTFYHRYETEWRPKLVAQVPAPAGDPGRWTRVQTVYGWYHNPDYFCPEPYEEYPSHLHIDLLERAQGQGHGRRMMERLMSELQSRGSPGAHLGVSALNTRALGFYQKLGFRELIRVGSGESGCVYLGKRLNV
jgi:protein O-GlcNAcase/histone acetyltransferase